MKYINIKNIIPLYLLSFLIFTACSYPQIMLDKWSEKDLVKDILKNYDSGNLDSLKTFIGNFSLEKETLPLFDSCIKVDDEPRWKLEQPKGIKLIQERISFPSLILKNNKKDTAYFYIYRKGDFKDRKVIIWIPGFRVSDFAFKFIKRFFQIELLLNYDIVFYVPPYHLERKISGMKDGDGFFTANTQHNLIVLLNMTREIRTVYKYLETKNVKNISAWGGSTGASSLLIASNIEKFDHLNLMIPVVDWANMAIDNPMMKEINLRLEQSGFADSLLRKAYSLVSPVNYRPLTSEDRIQIQNSTYDQLIPPYIIDSFCKRFQIRKHFEYKTSHGTILLSNNMFHDYETFLDSLK
jgi:hypothetical protein